MDFISNLPETLAQALFWLKVIALLLAVAAAAFLLRFVFGFFKPLCLGVRWLALGADAGVPGTRANEIAAGLAHGARIIALALLICAGLWLLRDESGVTGKVWNGIKGMGAAMSRLHNEGGSR